MPFPTTGVLDDFNRADAPTTLGANWTTGGPGTGWTSLGILSNQLYATGAFNANYWTAPFGRDEEVFCTVPTRGATAAIRMYLRLQNPSTASWNAYHLTLLQTGAVTLFKVVAGVTTSLLAAGSTYVSGDGMGLEAIGTTLTIYRKPAGGVWTADGSIVNADVNGGGVLCMGFPDDTSYRVDDFGGGTVVPPLEKTPNRFIYLRKNR